MVILRTTQPTQLMRSQRKNIRHKIGFGYGLAISIGFLGSMIGLIVADYYQGQGVEQLADANIQSQLLVQLKAEIERSQYYGLQSALAKTEVNELQDSQARLAKSLNEIKGLQAKMQDFFAGNPVWVATHPEDINFLINTAIQQLEIYQQTLETPSTLQSSSQPENITGLLAIQSLVENFNDIVEVAQQQSRQAEIELENAQGLEKFIIVFSALVSVAIAGIIAWRTTTAIAQPLVALTEVAQTVAQNSDFSLRVPVTTQDETGILAKSFNWLIESVAERTQQLECSVQTAEAQACELQKTLSSLQEMQLQLIQTEKMSSLGQLVAGIAHEINNPINFIHGNLDHASEYATVLLNLLELYQKEGISTPEIDAIATEYDLSYIQEDFPQLLASMQAGTKRIREIIVSLRTFSRLDEAELKTVDLHSGLESALLILQSRLKATDKRPKIQVITEYGNLPQVECYAGQLNQVFMNLLSNAIDALEDCAETRDNLTIWIRTEYTRHHRILIKIKDNGCGMDKKTQARLFDPFFTTKPIGKGTGLGLSISYRIITEKHNGQLHHISQVGKGTTFVISLPVRQQGLS
jgi:two-component system NtrC family sensor kinase